MAKLPIHWIEARTHCHGTETESSVEKALAFACPEADTAREVLEGHFGNPLVRLTRRVERGPSIRALWERWSTVDLLKSLASEVDARVDDDGILHFRLDKQAAFEGRLALAKEPDAIDVRVKLMAYPAKAAEARRVARSVVEGAV